MSEKEKDKVDAKESKVVSSARMVHIQLPDHKKPYPAIVIDVMKDEKILAEVFTPTGSRIVEAYAAGGDKVDTNLPHWAWPPKK